MWRSNWTETRKGRARETRLATCEQVERDATQTYAIGTEEVGQAPLDVHLAAGVNREARGGRRMV